MARDIEWEKHVARLMAEQKARTPTIGARVPGGVPLQQARRSLPERAVALLPTPASRDAARMVLHGLARTGNTILRAIDIPNRVFGNTRSVLQDIYERSEANLERDAYEDKSGVPQVGETAVHLASAGVLGKALPAVFGANVGADTYETAKYAGASEGEALAKGIGHGAVDTAIWTLGQGLASKYLPKAWQWLGREIIGAGRGAASSVASDTVLNSLGADISGEEMAKRAVHAAWMVPLLGMLKMGKGSRERALAELKKVRPDLAGERVDKVIETLENEFSDPRSQKVALAWVARKGANLPDDLAQIHQAIEVANKVKGVDFTQKSPFEIISDPRYARYLPKPRPQDVKAFSNMKRYPMGVIGFDVSDDAAGRQATREMINAYMSPSSNPWCLATGKDAARLGELGPGAEGYWKGHSAVPKQIFFQEVDGKLELTAFRATSHGGEGRQEYWDTSDAGYSGIPLKVKVPGDPMGRYRKMVFRPAGSAETQEIEIADPTDGRTLRLTPGELETEIAQWEGYVNNLETQPGFQTDRYEQRNAADFRAWITEARSKLPQQRQRTDATDEVQGTFEDIAPGKIFKGDPFRDGRSQTWVKTDQSSLSAAEQQLDEYTRLQNENPADPTWRSEADAMRETVDKIRHSQQYVLVEDKVRTTENGITKFVTKKYADPQADSRAELYEEERWKPDTLLEIEESELISPEWMRSRGYDPESESDVRRMQSELDIQAWGNGQEAAMAVVPTKRTYMQTESGSPETVTYGPNGRDIVSVDFAKDGVPYRLEYFHSGPVNADPSSVYHTIDYDEFPYPTTNIGINEPSGSRLTRNPDSMSPEVLNEVRWDEKLGGFVRTSGNRRWVQKGTGSSRIYAEDRLGSRRAMTLEEAQQEMLDLEDDVVNHGGLESHRRLHELEEAVERHHAEPESATISVEDRQPDGTWAFVGALEPSDPSSWRGPFRNTLPPPPTELPLPEAEPEELNRFQQGLDLDGDWDVQQAAKAGDSPDRFSMSRNFLATDKVPDTIFGIPVVANEEDYTPEDLAFFREHPEAGGYYDMGEETPEDGSAEGAPTQADMPRRGAYPGKLNNPGNVEKRAERRRGEIASPHKRWAKFATPQDGLREMADAIRQIADVKLTEKDQPFTIRNFAEVYAPRFNEKGEPENDTDKYIRDISSTSGIDADTVLDHWNTDDMAKLLKTVVRFESGVPHSEWFTDDEYRTAAERLTEGTID